MNLNQFKQLNLVAVINRANEILESITSLGVTTDAEAQIIDIMRSKLEIGDDWERASIELASLELIERRIRLEDPQCESAPEDWNGGVKQEFVK